MPATCCPQCKQAIVTKNGVCPRCRPPSGAERRGMPVGVVLGAIAAIVFLAVTALGTLGFLTYGLLTRKPPEPRAEVGAAPPKVERPAPKAEPPPPAKKQPKKESKQPAPPPKPKPEPPTGDVRETAALAEALLKQLNAYRTTAEIGPVQLDPELSRGCTAHARYLALNPPRPGMAARLLDEDPGKPGYSAEGRRAASFALVSIGAGRGAVDQWMGRLGARVPLLKPDLRAVGLGLQPMPSGAWAVVLDIVRGSGDPVVLYPRRISARCR